MSSFPARYNDPKKNLKEWSIHLFRRQKVKFGHFRTVSFRAAAYQTCGIKRCSNDVCFPRYSRLYRHGTRRRWIENVHWENNEKKQGWFYSYENNLIIAIILNGTAFLLQGHTDKPAKTFKFKMKDNVQYDTSEFTQQDGRKKRTFVSDKRDRPITYVFCRDLHLS